MFASDRVRLTARAGARLERFRLFLVISRFAGIACGTEPFLAIVGAEYTVETNIDRNQTSPPTPLYMPQRFDAC